MRSELMRAALELIEERGIAGLSLRECARRAGVSHAAPSRHFADRETLLRELAFEGFGLLTRAGRQAMDGLADPRARLDAYGVAYVRFAVEHAAYHRLMFSAELGPAGDEKFAAPEHDAFGLLVSEAAAVVGDEVDAVEAALAAWSLTHGLAMLILDGRMPPGLAETPDAAADLARRVISQWRGPLR